jgi:amphi-Trp domain-containing protein
MDKDKLAYRQIMTPAEAVTYLEGLVAGLKAGSVLVSQGEDSLTLTPGPDLEVEVEARRKKDKERFTVEFSWHVAQAVEPVARMSVGAPGADQPAAPCCAKAEAAKTEAPKAETSEAPAKAKAPKA